MTTDTADLSATYSPEDNKLRLRSAARLDAATYARVKAYGFSWAPKQEVFVAPAWTPDREDFLTSLCGEIGDEDSTLASRAEVRAERFEDYSDKRKGEARHARDAVAQIADNVPLGQPILIGHHSQRRAEKDAERIRDGMTKAVKLWETGDYWKRRAEGAVAHAMYKELPEVRARRIKTLEADQRKRQRGRDEAELSLKFWTREGLTLEAAQRFAGSTSFGGGFTMPRKEGDRPDFNQQPSAYSALCGDYPNLYAPRTLEEVVARALQVFPARITYADRWIAHYDNRLTYERAMLGESGYKEPPKRVSRAALPLLNYSGRVQFFSPYFSQRDQVQEADAHPMTKAEYAALHTDYKGTYTSADRTHRIRSAVVAVDGKRALRPIFLTDSKVHPKPGPVEQGKETAEQEQIAARIQKGRERLDANAQERAEAKAHNRALTAKPVQQQRQEHDPEAAGFQQLRQAAKAGVQVVAAPQLFPTPVELAQRMADMAGIRPGDRVLEPSAGTGRLLAALPMSAGPVVAVEINAALCQRLRADHLLAQVFQADFLEWEAGQTFDVILMNPPFERGADIHHIKRAASLLAPGGRLVAICAGGPRQAEQLQPLASLWEPLGAGVFAEQGTNVHTVLLTIER